MAQYPRSSSILYVSRVTKSRVDRFEAKEVRERAIPGRSRLILLKRSVNEAD